MATSVANPSPNSSHSSAGDRRSYVPGGGTRDCYTYTTPSGSFQSLDETDNSSSNDSAGLYGRQKHASTSPMMSQLLDREDERQKTFENFPHEWLDKQMLARCGFFYTGSGDKVKCQFCQIEIGHWDRTDEPVAEHTKWSRSCPLLRRMSTSNIPISEQDLEACLPALTYDVCGAYDYLEVHPYALPEDSISPQVLNSLPALNASRLRDGDTAGSPEVNQQYYPTYPEYAVESVRERSYAEWPRCIKQRPKQLAEAGFFYTGSGDRVNCFSCGCGLKDWEESDDAWEQHTLWSPHCRFLKLLKGQNYIDDILAQYAAKEAEVKKASARTSEATASSSAPDTRHSVSEATMQATTSATAATASSEVAASCSTAAENSKPKTPPVERQSVGADLGPSGITTLLANTDFTDDRLCKICYDEPYNTVFLPCGHVCACAKCATSVTSCPMCRSSFCNILRVCLP